MANLVLHSAKVNGGIKGKDKFKKWR
jgi:hypothetical protein